MADDMNRGGPYIAGVRDSCPSRAETDPGWIDSRDLFRCRDEIVIKHGGQMYRLRITRYGKLILNK